MHVRKSIFLSVALIAGIGKAVEDSSAKPYGKLIAQLSSEEFEVRQRATKSLQAFGVAALP